MEFLTQLWLPIVVSGVVVFFMSALVWTVMPHHKKDWQGLPNEDAVLAAMRTSPLAPGQYAMPFIFDPKLRDDPAMKERIAKGPNGYFTVIPTGSPAMGPMMAKSLVYQPHRLGAGCVRRVAFAAGRRRIPRGVPHRRRDRDDVVHPGHGTGVDLVRPAVADVQDAGHRRSRLWPGDGGNIRVALAKLDVRWEMGDLRSPAPA